MDQRSPADISKPIRRLDMQGIATPLMFVVIVALVLGVCGAYLYLNGHWAHGHAAGIVSLFVAGAVCGLLPAQWHLLRNAETPDDRFRALVEQSLAGIYIIEDHHWRYINPHGAQMFGRAAADMINRPVELFITEEDRERVRICIDQRLSGELEQLTFEYHFLRSDGSVGEVEVQSRGITFNGKPAIIGMMMEVGHLKAAEHQLRLTAKVFDNTMEGILVTDAEARIVAVNHAFNRITGYAAEEAHGRVSRMFRIDNDPNRLNEAIMSSLREKSFWQGELPDRRKNGESYPAWLSISALRDDDGQITHFVGVFSDMSARRDAEARLNFLANHDALTMLPNRTLLNSRLHEILGLARKRGLRTAVMFLDLDRFKTVNETLGHQVGDELLQEVALRLPKAIQERAVLARLGGDEFTIILENVPDFQPVADTANAVLAQMSRPFAVAGQDIYLTCSIGISLFPDDGQDVSTLLKSADMALYRAKELGKNNYQFFDAAMNAHAFDRLVIGNQLRQALERGEFLLHFQPLISVTSGHIAAVEALLRWQHPEFGLLHPTRFIPLAEENGVIVPMGAWVLREACLQIKRWQDAGLPPIRVAVNLSARQFQFDDLPVLVADALATAKLESCWLELELTESMIMKSPEDAARMMHELAAMGVTLAIDDFGTGYSSLSTLKRFPIHHLKIDRSFVEGIPDNRDDVAIAEVVIAMAKKMGLKVVAEGVETAAQAEFLRQQGCDFLQGYRFGRPMPADDLANLLENGFTMPMSAFALPV